MDTQAPGIGHNQPSIKEKLEAASPALFERVEELTEALSGAPRQVDTEETAKSVSDLLKMVSECLKQLESTRKAEQIVWERGLKETRATFLNPINALKDARAPVKEGHEAYLQRKKDEAKRKKEEEARKAREEAERLAREAAEAEARARAAEEAERKAKEEAYQAQLAREKALADARKAEEEGERRAAEAHAERKRLEREKAELQEQLAKQESKEAARESKASLDQAVRSETLGERKEMQAQGKSGDLHRIRTDHGAVSSLRKRKVAEIVNYEKLPKGILWPFIAKDAVQTAVNKAVANGLTERDLPGVRIVEIEEGVTV